MCRLCYKLLFKGGAVLTLLLMLGVFLPLAASAHSAYPAHTGSTGPSVAGPSQAVDCFNPHFGGASGTVGRMVAYIGSDLHIHIHDFTNNTDDRDPTQTTPTAPTITCQTVLVVIWKANDSSNKIFNGFYHCSDSSGTPPCGLHQVSAFNETTYTSPSVSAAPYGNCPIVLAWSGTDSQHHLYYKWANLGQLGSWSSTYKLTDYTWQDGGVSVTCDGTSSHTTWFSWVAASGTPYIHLGSLPSLGSTQLNDVPHSSDYTGFAPGMGAKNTIFFIWGAYNGTTIYTGHWSNGWGATHQQSDTTSYPPTIQCDGNQNQATTFTGTNNVVYYDKNAYESGCY